MWVQEGLQSCFSYSHKSKEEDTKGWKYVIH